MGLKLENYNNSDLSFRDFILNCEEYLQLKLNNNQLQIDKECKKIIYNGNLYSLDDNGNVVIENKGIILSKNDLNLQIAGQNKYDKTLEVIKLNINGDVVWETSNEKIAKVENGKIIPVSDGEVLITAICYDDKEYRATCKVNVESFIDDSYVQYDVEYDDIYTGKRFSRNTGWRLITQEQNEDGTYNIEFVSTGIPCKLCYGWYEIGKAVWKPTVDLKNQYVNRFYNTTSNRNATYAAAGLYYNFDKILFRNKISNSSSDFNIGGYNKILIKNKNKVMMPYNFEYKISKFTEYNEELSKIIKNENEQKVYILDIGGYNKILIKNKNKVMEEVEGEITGNVFIARKEAQVRNISLSDIRGYDKIEGKETGGVKSYDSDDEYADKKIGLFKLNDYSMDNKKEKSFFVSNPSNIKSAYHILIFKSSGTLNSSNGSRTTGLRPVITMKNVNMTKDGCVWLIN